MSLCIVLSTADGLVLAGDSRLSYINNSKVKRISSDYVSKIFKLNSRCGITSVGNFSLCDNEKNFRNINWFIDKFIEENRKDNKSDLDSLSIEGITNEINDYFSEIVKKNIEIQKEGIKKNLEKSNCCDIKFIQEIHKEKHQEKSLNLFHVSFSKDNKTMVEKNVIEMSSEFLITGYNKKDSCFECNRLNFLFSDTGKVMYKNKNNIGIRWSGQGEHLQRIILGYDARIFQFIKKKDHEEFQSKLSKLEVSIQYVFMTLQDGIDLAKLLIETTSALQRFSDGIIGDMRGGTHGVGGEIDVAVITKNEGFKWIQRKNNTLYGNEVYIKPS